MSTDASVFLLALIVLHLTGIVAITSFQRLQAKKMSDLTAVIIRMRAELRETASAAATNDEEADSK